MRAGRGWWILGGCQQQQHNRIREQNEGNRKDVMQTDGYLPHVLCARDHIGDISRPPPQREANLLKLFNKGQTAPEISSSCQTTFFVVVISVLKKQGTGRYV